MPSKKNRKTGPKCTQAGPAKKECVEQPPTVQAEPKTSLERLRENDDEVIRRVRDMKNLLFPNMPNAEPTISTGSNSLQNSQKLNRTPKLLREAEPCIQELAEAFRDLADGVESMRGQEQDLTAQEKPGS
ncbi:unnamed protein product, partial [Mesorhabditis spiculigera]